MQKAGLPSVLEPLGVDGGDSKRPPFKNGMIYCLDGVCVGTYAETHLLRTAISEGYAATGAEMSKRRKYVALTCLFQFEPIALKSASVYGKSTAWIVKDIGHRLVVATGVPLESL